MKQGRNGPQRSAIKKTGKKITLNTNKTFPKFQLMEIVTGIHHKRKFVTDRRKREPSRDDGEGIMRFCGE